MSERTAFVLNVRPDKVDEYIRAHAEVWPEMLAALREAGYRNYTIFRHGTTMFGYFESDDPAAAAEFMERQPVNRRWQDAMAGLLTERVPDAGPAGLEEVFRLH
jgi:L-rhamnose mutarotase